PRWGLNSCSSRWRQATVRRAMTLPGWPRHLRGFSTGSEEHGEEPMAMTPAVKDELSRVIVNKTCCRKAEASSLLRFAGGLHIVAGRVVVEAELDTGSVARRLRRDIGEVYGHATDVHVLAGGGLRKGSRYVVRVARDGENLARQTGLLDLRGRPVRGLPPQVGSGGLCDAEAAWRGAVPGHGPRARAGRAAPPGVPR